jgi:NADH-quinone oxidoreductase subunit E
MKQEMPMDNMSELDIEDSVDAIISKHKGRHGALLSILEELQARDDRKYISPATMEMVSKKLNIPQSHIFSMASFYSFFNLRPQGDHSIVICRGTACHTRRSKEIFESLENMLDFDVDSPSGKVAFTTRDNLFTIKTVACFGQCALAPVVEVDGVVHSNMTIEATKKIVNAIEASKKSNKGTEKEIENES